MEIETMMCSIACGIFLIDKNDKLLIVHPTNCPESMWSIPKGIRNAHDSDDFTAAKRELLEETGIDIESDIDKCEISCLGIVTYRRLRKKKLIGFACKLDFEINQELRCDSYVDSNGRGCCFVMGETRHREGGGIDPFPEVDQFKWVTFQEAMRLMPLSQKKLLGVYLYNYAWPWETGHAALSSN
ncbi:NUDIX hydrolase [Thermodesulfobacteriota bacterium]